MDSATWTSLPAWANWTLGAIAFVVLFVLVVIVRKGRKRPGEFVFRASRISRGNRVFPAQVVVTPESVTHYRPQFIGKLEESIHMAHISSIKIDTDILFSDVLIETTGGHHPVVCHGHTKGDAVRMKQTIERFQTDYYRKPPA
jgi:hypothetical protein